MSHTIDACGLSCPQPVLMVLDKLKQQPDGNIVVFVDSETAKENVSRAAIGQGWSIKYIQNLGEKIQMTLKKKQ